MTEMAAAFSVLIEYSHLRRRHLTLREAADLAENRPLCGGRCRCMALRSLKSCVLEMTTTDVMCHCRIWLEGLFCDVESSTTFQWQLSFLCHTDVVVLTWVQLTTRCEEWRLTERVSFVVCSVFSRNVNLLVTSWAVQSICTKEHSGTFDLFLVTLYLTFSSFLNSRSCFWFPAF